MIVSLNPYFPQDYPPTLLTTVIEANRDRLPAGTRFAYFRLRTYHHFCMEPASVVASDADAVRRIVETSDAVLFDLSHEGPVFINQLATALARFAKLYGVPPERMIFFSTNEEFLGQLRAFTQAPRISAGVRWVWFHHYLYQLAMMAKRRGWFRKGHHFVDTPAARRIPFLSLNATARGHRALLAYLIATHARRDAFVCSFNLDGPKLNLPALLEVVNPMASRLGLTWETIEPVLADPSRFDTTRLADLPPPALVRELEPELYERTRISLVTETEMSSGRIRRTTEKSFKPVLLGQPVVAFANPHTLALLRDLGIDTFDDVLDNGYDAIARPADRFFAAWRLAEDLLAGDAGLAVDPALADRLHANVALFEGEILRRVVDRTMGELAAALV